MDIVPLTVDYEKIKIQKDLLDQKIKLKISYEKENRLPQNYHRTKRTI